MPPKRKNESVDMGAARQKFQKRGDLGILKSGNESDCDLIAGEHKFHVHRAILASRGGHLERLLNANGKGPADDNIGKTVVVIESHSAKSIDLVLEFIYGASKIEDIEHPAPGDPFIKNCIYIYNLGYDFEITSLSKYAIWHLGSHLSRKLKEVCVYPLSDAKAAAARNGFVEDLVASIIEADVAHQAGRKLPLDILTDFVVVARDVLLQEAGFRLSIDEDILPYTFVKKLLLAQTYQTSWMKNLMVRPKEPQKLQPRKGWKCDGCGEKVAEAEDEAVVFNPFSGLKFLQRYTQVCCEECAQGMDKGHGKGASWAVFGDAE